MPNQQEKPLVWVGSSKRDLIALPAKFRKFFGHALHLAQHGEQHDAAKVLKGFDGAGVLEIVEHDQGGTYRAVYTSNSARQFSCCTCSRKRASAALQHRSRI